ncbi:hypothetical protein [Paenibacillus endoradicis]|uniref:hypothetical protein n=1 Tax=Paenibacillus endoradicis TaxID=2972487 RepID=UPI002158B8F3|nr:hypothetical protein [Paenibacillus endoradicis]MCR8656930.1 hypothetical protein [Paenibacillus endoradicis]
MDKKDNLDQTLNLGTEIRLSETLKKHIKIGTIKTIRDLRKLMNGVKYNFQFCIGREKGWFGDDKFDFPEAEAKYREAFNTVLDGGLSDDEYDSVDEEGIKELDSLLTRFL